ncbi:MAG: nucleotidyltransferase domain-containing protein [Spirochaetaceae bacterium]|nr:nucleotidyltransferase domain-containing protein [Spirochaetaceae bacterium]
MLTQEITSKISNVLSDMGCSECYIFGSHVTGNANENSDIDIGIKGLPPHKFFATHSMLEDATGKTIDLVDFDEKPQFFALLQDLGELRKIG